MLKPLLERRTFAMALVAAGCPKQGEESESQEHRRAGQIPAEVVADMSALLGTVVKAPVWSLLEKETTVPKSSVEGISKALKVQPILVDARTFGWVSRPRWFWAASTQGEWQQMSIVMPKDLIFKPPANGRSAEM